MRILWCVALIACLGLLDVGCAAPDYANSTQAAQLQPEVGAPYLLSHPVSMDLPGGFSGDDLAPGTHWLQVGTIAQGSVYKLNESTTARIIYQLYGNAPIHYANKQVPTLYTIRAGGETCEAYIVVKDNVMTGLYLPDKSLYVLAQPELIYLTPSN